MEPEDDTFEAVNALLFADLVQARENYLRELRLRAYWLVGMQVRPAESPYSVMTVTQVN